MTETIKTSHRTLRREPDQDRVNSAHLRHPPDFIILGAQKGGTTSLYHYLADHPEVGTNLKKKEIHFFSSHFDRGMDWYLAHFPLRGEAAMVGEASPSYLVDPKAPERLHGALPRAKLIALLRNPVDRAYSHHQMKFRKGLEKRSFEEAIDQDSKRLHSRKSFYFTYVTRGIYADQLRRWLELFPREQLLVIKSEELYQEPERIYAETLEYLGLQPWRLAEYGIHRAGTYEDGLQPETRARLAAYFAPHNRQLYALLGRNLGWDDA